MTAPNEMMCHEDEELIAKCRDVIFQEKRASVSLIQRRFRIGYPRALSIMDELERRKIVGPKKPNQADRDILVSLPETPPATNASERETCPRCGAHSTQEGKPSKRTFFSCGTYIYEDTPEAPRQSEYCATRQELAEARERIAVLESRVAFVKQRTHDMSEVAQAQAEEIERLRGVLQQVEWGARASCPCCLAFKEDGHYPRCDIEEALAKKPECGNPYNYRLGEYGLIQCRCGKLINRAYLQTPNLTCWSCREPIERTKAK